MRRLLLHKGWLHGKINEVVLATDRPDRLIYTPSDRGRLSTKNFLIARRSAGEEKPWAKWIWHRFLPHNISAFLWRLMRHGLPVDRSVQARGVTLVSHCRCYTNPQTEELRHLLIKSEIAVAVWRCFGEIFRLPYQFGSVMQALNIWMVPTNSTSQYAICRASVATYVLREIWVERCTATFEGKTMKARAICLRILQRVQPINMAAIPTKNTSSLQALSLAIMGISKAAVQTKRGVCRWDKPSPGWVKLNIRDRRHDYRWRYFARPSRALHWGLLFVLRPRNK